MSTRQPTSAKQVCENLLLEERRYNTENKILPSENKVIDRLIDRGVEMSDAYGELAAKLGNRPPALQVFLGLVLSAAAFWNPEKMYNARDQRNELVGVNQAIAANATKLTTLLRKRSEIENSSGFSGNTHYSICNVIEVAGKNNHLFNSWVRDRLQGLHGQFDLKYWPSLEDCLKEIAADAQYAVVEATDPITASATKFKRASLTDFFRALFTAIEENGGHLPADLTLTDGALASIANCALDLDPENLVQANYVKQLRQRMRNQGEE